MKALRIIAIFAMILALGVVVLGAYTRLTDAGLGCPDWPGCYGRLVLPSQTGALQALQAKYPLVPIESQKAWTEMAHRYVAGVLLCLVLVIATVAWRYRHQGAPRAIPLLLLGVIGFQAALGMWTVTLKLLPVVVMGHLLGGMTIFGCLVFINAQLFGRKSAGHPSWCRWVDIGLVILVSQIALGGWVSANYAGLACIGFPTCNGQWLPQLSWQSFQLWHPIGANYQGGLLDIKDRITIQMVHRIGAAITALYFVFLSSAMLRCVRELPVRRLLRLLLLALGLQIALGVANVWYLLPLWVAVAHNAVATLCLALLLGLRYYVGRSNAYSA